MYQPMSAPRERSSVVAAPPMTATTADPSYAEWHCLDDSRKMPLNSNSPTSSKNKATDNNDNVRSPKETDRTDTGEQSPRMTPSPQQQKNQSNTTTTACHIHKQRLPQGVPLSRPPILVTFEFLTRGEHKRARKADTFVCESKVYYPKGTYVVSNTTDEDNSENQDMRGSPKRRKTGFSADGPLAPPPYVLPHRS